MLERLDAEACVHSEPIGGEVPDFGGAVTARGERVRAIGRDADRLNAAGVPHERADADAGGEVPYLGGVITARGERTRAVGRDANSKNLPIF